MHSMTGFGVGEAPLGDGRLTLELRALNHRFLEVRVRLPNELAEHAFFLEQLAREKLSRGRFEVGVRIAGSAAPVPKFSVERGKALSPPVSFDGRLHEGACILSIAASGRAHHEHRKEHARGPSHRKWDDVR